MSAMHDDMKKMVETLVRDNASLTKKYTAINDTVTELSERLNNLEQHLRESNLEIQAVPESHNENLPILLQQCSRVVGHNIQQDDVIKCTRVAKLNKENYIPVTTVCDFFNKCGNIITNPSDHMTCILGDVNLGNIKWSIETGCPLNHNCEKSTSLFNLFQSTAISQLNHLVNLNGRILDLAITNCPDLFTLTPSIPISRLDVHHPPFELVLSSEAASSVLHNYVEKLCFRKTDYDSCKRDISLIDWTQHALGMSCDNFTHHPITP
ncbi:hypothetical protein HW555_006087 [Spodoptera exigua]|uniref:Endonuclease/exonuclease/phosphatase domain-containing protein n=1 Tax=Spodoptera exigua TaxID=7107 RepID=A0A835LAH0_SPOEX|nr:hypothetical protein HW555_006087 [Spodoptera exigua]